MHIVLLPYPQPISNSLALSLSESTVRARSSMCAELTYPGMSNGLISIFKLSTTKPVTPIEPNRPMLPKCYSLESSASLWYLFSNFWKCATVGSFHELPLLVFLLTNGCNEPPLYANKSLTISSYIFLLIVSIYVIWC